MSTYESIPQNVLMAHTGDIETTGPRLLTPGAAEVPHEPTPYSDHDSAICPLSLKVLKRRWDQNHGNRRLTFPYSPCTPPLPSAAPSLTANSTK